MIKNHRHNRWRLAAAGLAAALLAGCAAPAQPSAAQPDCVAAIPADHWQVDMSNLDEPAGRIVSMDNQYAAIYHQDAQGCAQLEVWACDGSGMAYQTGQVCSAGNNVGDRPVRWTKNNCLLVASRGPEREPGYYWFSPKSKQWEQLAVLPGDNWPDRLASFVGIECDLN